MSVWAAHRGNPFSGPLMSIITTIPFTFFGATLGSLFWIGLLRIVLDYLIHSEIKHDWGWIGRWILVSPMAHRVHHSGDPKHFKSNYGFFIIFWDRVFGTYVEEPNIQKFGVVDEVYNKSSLIHEFFVYPVVCCYKSFFKEYRDAQEAKKY